MAYQHKDSIQQIARKEFSCTARVERLRGGDINDVYRIRVPQGDFVVKINRNDRYPGLFEAEKRGLQLLDNSPGISVPRVYGHGVVNNVAYLILEHIESGIKSSDFWRTFGQQLAKLHKNSSTHFGLDTDNYIGSLKQYNRRSANAADFYIGQRLEPQIALAADNGFLLGSCAALFRHAANLIPNEPPSLVHGDLWSGNYLVSTQGQPVLIDPAVAYAPREMDLAMMQLFGGFPDEVFLFYNEVYQLDDGFTRRLPLWQLYYLLVHLNLFGSGYLGQVRAIIKRYS